MTSVSKKRLLNLAGMLRESPYHLPGYDRWKTAGPPEESEEPCDRCGGEGEIWTRGATWADHDDYKTCSHCGGTGIEPPPEEPDIFPPEEPSEEDAWKIASLEDEESGRHELGEPKF